VAHSYPKDRFDATDDDLRRVGAHRAPRRRARAWIWIGWCALATVIIVGAGILGISIINGNVAVPGFSASSGTPTPTSTPTPTITPVVNPELEVTVLNGTTQTGLAGDVATTLGKAGWKKVSTANASETDLKETIVYYSDDANKAAALGLAQSLPGATIQKTKEFVDTGAALTVVVGSDQIAGK